VLDDVTSAALHTALTGLAQRQRVIADNIANIQTPGYTASRVNFEDALRSAVSSGSSPNGVVATTFRSTDAPRADGNNVSLDQETLSNVDTGLRYQLLLRAVDAKHGLIHDVIKSGG
jgi:flagellar basal-body rod protein FlgB